jgi:hypothetical protein
MFQPPNPKVRTSLLKATPEDDCFCFASQMISPSNLFTLQKVSDFSILILSLQCLISQAISVIILSHLPLSINFSNQFIKFYSDQLQCSMCKTIATSTLFGQKLK